MLLSRLYFWTAENIITKLHKIERNDQNFLNRIKINLLYVIFYSCSCGSKTLNIVYLHALHNNWTEIYNFQFKKTFIGSGIKYVYGIAKKADQIFGEIKQIFCKINKTKGFLPSNKLHYFLIKFSRIWIISNFKFIHMRFPIRTLGTDIF